MAHPTSNDQVVFRNKDGARTAEVYNPHGAFLYPVGDEPPQGTNVTDDELKEWLEQLVADDDLVATKINWNPLTFRMG